MSPTKRYTMSVDAPWKDGVDVATMTEADFERRDTAITIYDGGGDYERGHARRTARAIAETEGITEMEAADRAVRIYVAYWLDTHDGTPDLRAEYDVTALLPPRGWVEGHDFEAIDVPNTPIESGQMAPSLPPTVKAMVKTLVNDYSDVVGVDTLSTFCHEALSAYAAGDY